MTTPRISFEFFPPQTLDASFRLWEAVQVFAPGEVQRLAKLKKAQIASEAERLAAALARLG